MTTKARLIMLEQRLSVKRESYKMSDEEVAHQRKVFGWMLQGTVPKDNSILIPFREAVVESIFNERETKLDKDKLYEQFNNFFFKNLTVEEQADFALEMLCGDVLPENYEFKTLQKYLAFIEKIGHNVGVAHSSQL